MNSVMESVRSVCKAIKRETKQGSCFPKLLTTVRREFKREGFDLKVKSVKDKTLNQNMFYVNAYYDAEEDEDGSTPIEIVIHHNFDKEEVWKDRDVSDLLVQIFDAVVHEFKHQRQSKKRNYKQYWQRYDANDFRLYLKDPDEVDAYSLSIAIELCRTLGKFRALRYLANLHALSRLKIRDQFVSPNLSAYIGQFEGIDNPTIKLLSKKVYIRLQKIDTDSIFI